MLRSLSTKFGRNGPWFRLPRFTRRRGRRNDRGDGGLFLSNRGALEPAIGGDGGALRPVMRGQRQQQIGTIGDGAGDASRHGVAE